MYLEKLIILNYQSCQKVELELYKDEPTILFGINDSGKSIILKSIDLLFDGKTQFNFFKEDKVRSDISNTKISEASLKELFNNNNLPYPSYDEKQTFIIGRLKVEKDDIVSGFEDNISTHLIWSLEKSEEDILWLMKVFDESNYSVKDYLLVLDAKDKPLNLWIVKAKELTQLRKDHDITDEEVENENEVGRFKNIEQLRAIYKKLDLQYYWSEYKEKKKDKSFFPEISYLDWNFSFDDLISFTNTIMNQSVSSNLDAAKTFANEKAKMAQEIVNKDLDEMTEYLGNEVPTIKKIKSNVFFNVQSRITDLVLNKSNTDQDIHLESQGDGVKRLIWFAMIKWKAKKTLKDEKKNKKLIWCFDEPETHLYPGAQREFFNKIKTVSNGNVQTIISTHSTIFVDRINLLQINNIFLDSGYSTLSKCKSIDDVFESLNLKNSDFLFYDKFLIIEGDTERYLIPHIYRLYTNNKLESDNIQLINLSGKNKWIERKKALENIFSDFKKSEESIVYLFDADMKFEIGQNAISDNMFFVGKQDIEDSISYEVWSKVVDDITCKEIELTKEEYDSIIESIPDDTRAQREDKFLQKLEKKLREKLSTKRGGNINYDILPSKGQNLAKLIINHINSINDLDKKIIEAFKKLLNQNGDN